jgi:endonuclease-8
MEGPSLVIATIEMQNIVKEKVLHASGNSHIVPFEKLYKSQLLEVKSWGKHLLLRFSNCILKIHFLMYGSYRIDDEKEGRSPRLQLKMQTHDLYFYSCSIKELTNEEYASYDWSGDVMSESWDPDKAVKKVLTKKNEMVCDVLMDQNIFAGVGNIIKNEVLFRVRLHPETKIRNISKKKIIQLVEEAKNYCEEFFEWKVLYIFKSHWKIMRKKECPACFGKLERRKTGKLERWSFFCPHCQERSLPAYHLLNS